MEAGENYLSNSDLKVRDVVTNQMSKHAHCEVFLYFLPLLFIHFGRLKTIKEGLRKRGERVEKSRTGGEERDTTMAVEYS